MQPPTLTVGWVCNLDALPALSYAEWILAIAAKFLEAGAKPDYAFFFSYMNPKTGSAMSPNAAEELIEANVPIFDNFLQSLPKAGIKPTRILLQTGGKNYGM